MPNVVLLDRDKVRVEAGGVRATCVIFLHAVEDWPTRYLEEFADGTVNSNALGIWVSEYALEYEDGTQASTPVWRRFAIQQSHIL
jgi:hypothetical protein